MKEASRSQEALIPTLAGNAPSPIQCSESSLNEASQIEIGKVFVVVGGKRKCLICDGVFTPTQAAEHATAPCCVVFNGSSDKSVC